MKLDMDFIREILLQIEKSDKFDGVRSVTMLHFDGHPEDQTEYHLSRMIQGGFLDGVVRGHRAVVKGLTWEGHQFLDEIRNDTVWQRVKHRAMEKTGALTFDLVRALAIEEGKGLLEPFALANTQAAAPASDRTVPLDHNSRAYRDAVSSLENVEKALRESNEYPDAEDREQRIAELSATRRLLDAPRVDVDKIQALGVRVLRYLADKVAGAAIGFAALSALGLLGKLVGLY
jgi:hypothetical protein